MRAPVSFGSIRLRVTIPVFAITLSLAPVVNAQLPLPGLAGGFEIDGNLISNTPGGILGLGDDWLNGPAGPGDGVLTTAGTPKDATSTLHVLDGIEGGDADVFDGSNKVLQNPNSYKWKSGSAPQKDDMQNALVYMTMDDAGQHWMRIAGDRRSVNGDSYIDYEFLQATLTQNANGTFSSAGPDGGRTVGDILLTIQLANGGSQAHFYAQRWESDGDGGFTYVDIPIPAGSAFVAANIDSAIATSFAAFGSNTYAINQFGEAAVNLNELLPNFNACFGVATVFVRTKSSTSPDAVLKDFVAPVQVNMCLDVTAPTLVAPPDAFVACGESIDPADLGFASGEDACDANVAIDHVDTIVPGACAGSYTILREWSATDQCGNTTQAVQSIVVTDDTVPVVLASPGPLSLQCLDDVPAPDADLVSASDLCGEVTVRHLSDVSDGNSCPEVITRTYRVTDECGNATDVTQLITIDDTIAPSITPLTPLSIQCGTAVPAPDADAVVATDACGGVNVVHVSDVSNGQSCPERITRTYRATDACGNSTLVTQTITIDDTLPPSLDGPEDMQVACVGDVPPANLALLEAGDNCGEADLAHVSDTSDGKSCPQVITRRYRATDACGNTTDWVQRITVDDTVAPQASGPSDIAVSCIAAVPAANIGLIQATDNCGQVTVAHITDSSDGGSCPQVITRLYRATDACGNTTDVVQRITVDDNTPPTADPLSTVTVSCASSVPAPNPAIVEAADNCGTPSVIFVGDVSDQKSCPETITRRYRVLDACGNALDVTQRIVIDDEVAPVVTSAPGPITIECDGDIPAANPDLVVASDNCGLASITHLGDVSDGKSCPRTVTRTYRVRDECGNVTDVTQRITIDDTTAPVLAACEPDRTLECPTDIAFTRPEATDNCDSSPAVRIVASDSTLGPEAWTFRVSRTWQAFDECGNASEECRQVVTAHCEVDALCSFTQGAYGTYGGYFNGMSTIQLIRSLLDDAPLVVGKPGRSLKFNLNAADCIVLRLPAGGTATTLPAIGNATINHNSCQTGVPIPLDSNGKFHNVLLGQTITLTLNTRLSPWMPLFPLTERFCTQGALPGPDKLMGTADDVRDVNSPVETYVIQPAVLTALDTLGLPRLVAGLVELCNRALAGHPTGGATLSQINNAADAINNGFDGCRFIVDCEPKVAVDVYGARRPGIEAGSMTLSTAPTRFEVSQNAPNPFNPATTIRFALPEAASWTVAIFDVAGRLVNRFDGSTSGAQYVDVRWDGTNLNGAPVASGVYLYQVQAGRYRDVRKMVLLK